MNLSKCREREMVNQMYKFGEGYRVLGLYLKDQANPFWNELYRQSTSAFERRSAGLVLEMLKRLLKSLPVTSSSYQRCSKIVALADSIENFDESFLDDRLYAAACLSYVSGQAFHAAMHSHLESSTQFGLSILKNFRDFTEEDFREAKQYLEDYSPSAHIVPDQFEAIKAYVELLGIIFK